MTDYETRILRVVDHIHDNPMGDLSLDALADVAALSRFHFHRVYYGMTGETVAQTVRRMRLHRAATALVRSVDPLAQIARSSGYPNLSSFSRAFADGYGMPPATFRKRGVLRPVPPNLTPKGAAMYPVKIRTEKARTLAALRHTGPYHQINRAFEKLSATLKSRDMFGKVTGMVAVYYDDPNETPTKDLRSYAAFIHPGPLAPPLEKITLPAGRHAVLTFKGPYAGLPAAYNDLFSRWLPASGEKPADFPSFEVYLNSPMDTAADDLLTEICLPLT